METGTVQKAGATSVTDRYFIVSYSDTSPYRDNYPTRNDKSYIALKNNANCERTQQRTF